MAKRFGDSEKNNGFWLNTINDFYRYGYNGYTDYVKTLNAITPADICAFMKDFNKAGNHITVMMLRRAEVKIKSRKVKRVKRVKGVSLCAASLCLFTLLLFCSFCFSPLSPLLLFYSFTLSLPHVLQLSLAQPPPLYDPDEAKAVVRTLLDSLFGMTLTDIVCGAVDSLSAADTQRLFRCHAPLKPRSRCSMCLAAHRSAVARFAVRPVCSSRL